jgi:hypothetical protein
MSGKAFSTIDCGRLSDKELLATFFGNVALPADTVVAVEGKRRITDIMASCSVRRCQRHNPSHYMIRGLLTDEYKNMRTQHYM